MSQTTAGLVGGAFVLSAIAVSYRYMGPPITVLSAGLVIAFALWIANYRALDRLRGRRIPVVYGVALGVQVLHFFEEYLTGFHREFPALWGHEWSATLFATFNIVALGVFLLAGIGVLAGVRLSFLLVWLMALVGGVGNGVFHTGITLIRGTYFPGSLTALLHLAVGAVLLRELINLQKEPAAFVEDVAMRIRRLPKGKTSR